MTTTVLPSIAGLSSDGSSDGRWLEGSGDGATLVACALGVSSGVGMDEVSSVDRGGTPEAELCGAGSAGMDRVESKAATLSATASTARRIRLIVLSLPKLRMFRMVAFLGAEFNWSRV